MHTDDFSDDELIPDPKVWQRYGVTSMTLWRWDRDLMLGFPQPIWIRGRKYRSRKALEAFDRRRAAISAQEPRARRTKLRTPEQQPRARAE
jgi:hypothetical protein